MRREQNIIRHHHERVDGKGYPAGLVGDQLDYLTKIITVVDSYDAMTSRRNYKKNKTMKEALDELDRCRGTRFDPDMVDVFSKAIVDFKPIMSDFSEDSLEGFYGKEVSLN